MDTSSLGGLLRFGGRQRGQVLAALAAALIALGIASAHVTVNPRSVPPDSFEAFTVRVPTEKEQPTIQLRIEFPAGLTVSRFQPKAGWKREVEKDGAGRITAATWSGGQIAPDEYEEFAFVARTPEAPGKLVFKAYQTYQGGEVVAWVNPEGEDEPAPVVEVMAPSEAAGEQSGHENGAIAAVATGGPDAAGSTGEQPQQAGATAGAAAAGASGSGAQVAAAPGQTGATSPSIVAGASGGSDLPLFTALGALVVALLALALAGVALARQRGPA